ncbi:unnamed protein product [marine sediment metagenome]|uniref:Uncharacterized protein n=1 Tax=marine sediment metagenome TaxID=412755 RepID=X1I6H0_9ZZZZ
MTGAFIRVKRKGKWENIEFECLTDKEMENFAKPNPKAGWKWAFFFAKFIRDRIEPLLVDLVKDGILEIDKGVK